MTIITIALISKKAPYHLQSYIRKKNEKINEHYYTNCLYGLKYIHSLNSIHGDINYYNLLVHKNQGYLGYYNPFSQQNFQPTEKDLIFGQQKDMKALCYNFAIFFDDIEQKLQKKSQNNYENYTLSQFQLQTLRNQLQNEKFFQILKSILNCEISQIPSIKSLLDKYDIIENESCERTFQSENEEKDKKNKKQITQLNCLTHPTEEITLFCDICNKFLCWQCVNQHQDHNFSGYDYEGYLKKANEAIQNSSSKFKELKAFQKKLVYKEDDSYKKNKEFIDITLRTNIESISKIINQLNIKIDEEHNQFTSEQSTFYDQFTYLKKDFRKFKRNIQNLKDKKFHLIRRQNLQEIENYKFSDVVQQQINQKEDQARKLLGANWIKSDLEKIREPLNSILLKLKEYLCPNDKNGYQQQNNYQDNEPYEKKVKKVEKKSFSRVEERLEEENNEIVISDSDGGPNKSLNNNNNNNGINHNYNNHNNNNNNNIKPVIKQKKQSPLQSYKDILQQNSKQQHTFNQIKDKMKNSEVNKTQYKYSNYGFDEDELLYMKKKQQQPQQQKKQKQRHGINSKLDTRIYGAQPGGLLANWDDSEMDDFYLQKQDEEMREKEEIKSAKKLNQVKRKGKKRKGKKNENDSSSDCMIIDI